MRWHCKSILSLVTVLGLLQPAAWAQSLPQSMNLQGRIYGPNSQPLESTSVVYTVEIRSPGAENCLLYKETFSLNMNDSDGLFSLNLGSGTRVGTGFEGTGTLAQVFSNKNTAMSPVTCQTGATTFTPTAGQERKIKMSFNDGSGEQTITESVLSKSVPYALHADSLQGKGLTDFIQVKSTGAAVTQTNLESVFASGANVTELLALIAGTSTNYAKVNGSNFAPTAAVDMNSQRITNVATPTAGTDATNRNYVDANIGGKATDAAGIAALAPGDAGKALIWDGTQWTAAAGTASDATKLPLAGGTMSGAIAMGGNNITGVGYLNISAQKYLGLGSFDDTQEGTLVTSTLTPGGNAYKGATWYNSTDNVVKYWNGSAVIVMATGATALTSLNGSTQPVQTFATPGTSGTAPAWSTNAGTGAHTLNVPMASAAGVTAGLVSKTDYDAFAAKQSATLADGNILVGNGSNVATAVTASGDATMTNAGVVTVGKVQGKAFASTAPTDGQVYVWNNTASQWQPKNFNASNLISAAGTSQFANASCAAGQTLTWSALTDTFTCTNISVTKSQVSDLGTVGDFFKDGSVAMTGALTMDQLGANPAGTASKGTVFVKNDGKLYYRDGTGTVLDLTAGNAALTTLNGSTVQSQTFATPGTSGTAPAWSTNTGTGAHTLNVPMASAAGVTAGLLSKTDYDAFAAKQSSSLANGKILVGDAGGAAAAVTPSGDATMTNAGAITVGKIQGNAVKTGTPTDLQVLTWVNGNTQWEPKTISITKSQVSDFPTLGTAAGKDFGTAAGELVELDGGGKVPAALLPSGTGDFMKDGSVAMTGNIKLGGKYLSNDGGSEGVAVDDNGLVGIGTTAPNEKLTVEGGMTLKQLAANPTGTAAYGSVFVKNDGKLYYRDGTGTVMDLTAGNAAMTSLNGSSVQAQTFATPGTSGTAPAWSTNTGTGAHTLNIPLASAASVTAGLISKTDYDAFAAKQTSTLADGAMLVGNGSNVATAVTASGDATMTNAGVITVGKVQGKAFASTAPTDGQVYVWNNTATQWQPKNFNVSNLISAAGTSQFANASCAAGQTLTWSALTDTFTCTNISVTVSQVSDAGTAAGKDFGTAAGELVELDGGGKIPAALMPSSMGDFFKDGSVAMTGALTMNQLGANPAGTASKGTVFVKNDGKLYYRDGTGTVLDLTAGNAAMTSLNGSTVQSQTFATPGTSGTAPAWSTNTGTGVHTLDIPLASGAGVTAGLLSKTDYDSFAAKQSTTLTDGKILVGNGSNVATAVTPSGDATMTNAGAITVGKIQGNAVKSGTPTDLQVLTWVNGNTQWEAKTISITKSQVSDFPTLGTAAGKDFGTAAGELVELDGGGKVPAALLPSGTGDFMKDGSVAMTGNIKLGGKYLSNDGGSEGVAVDDNGLVGIGTTAPNEKLTVEGGMTLKQLAANPTGTAAYGSVFVKNDGKLYYRDGTGTVMDLTAGNAAMTSLNGSSVQAQTFATPGTSGTAPAWSTNTGTGAHTLNIPLASAASVTAGLISKTDYDAFNAKQTSTLADGKILVGDSSNVAAAVTASGDATMTNAGVITVAKVQNRAIASTAPTDGQVYIWNNTASQWQPKNFNVSNLISAAGTSQFANASCAAGQTLTWSALTDTFTCTNISITVSQVSDAGTAAGKDFGTAAGELVELDGGGKIPSSLLPSSTGDFMKDGSVAMTGALTMNQLGANPAGTASKGTVFVKNDGKLYYRDGTGTVTDLLAGSAALTTLNGSTVQSQTFATPGTSGTAPAWSTNTGTGAHTLNIPMASTASVTAGLLSKTDYDSFAAKQSATLTDGKILVGNGSNVATAVTPSGDATMTNAGAITVAKIQGKAITNAAPTDLQVLTWVNGNSQWEPKTISITKSQVSDLGTVGDFLKDGSVAMTGNIKLGGKWLSNDGGDEGIAVTDTGYVGVGVAPSYPLDVSGNTRISGSVGIGTNPPATSKLSVVTSGVNTGITGTNSYTGVDSWGGKFTANGAATNNIGIYATASGATNNYAAIFDAGRVGIGTTAPNEKLTLEGAMTMKQLASNPAGTATYGALFVRDDGKLYYRNGTGTITDLIAGASAMTSLNGSTAQTQTFATPGTSGTAPAWSTNTGTGVHTLDIPMASTASVTAGLLSKTDYDAFNAKQSATLTDGKVWVGNGSNVATAVTPSGDATMTNAGVVTVAKIHNRAIASTAPTDGQVYVWVNGSTQWQPKNFNASNLISAAGTAQFANSSCATSQTLTWSALTDTFTCSNISITKSQISDLGTVGVGDFLKDGSVTMTGNIKLGGKWLSNDGGNEGVSVDNSGNVGVGTATPQTNYKLTVSGGVYSTAGASAAAGVYGINSTASNTGYGGYFSNTDTSSNNNFGVYGITTSTGSGSAGVYGKCDSANCDGVWGESSAGIGVYGGSSSGIGVQGSGNPAVYGTTGWNTSGSTGVFAENAVSSGTTTVYGLKASLPNSTASGSAAVYATIASGGGAGTVGSFSTNSTGAGTGVYGAITGASNTGFAIKALNNSSTGWGLYSSGTSPNYFAGKVGVGTTSPGEMIEVVGNVKATAFVSTSDRRLKTDIHPAPGLAAIERLNGVQYKWIKSGEGDGGVIAQEVEAVFPDAVRTDAVTGYKGVKYQFLFAPVIESIKELHGMCKDNSKKIEQIERRLASVEEENSKLKSENDALKRRMDAIERKLGIK